MCKTVKIILITLDRAMYMASLQADLGFGLAESLHFPIVFESRPYKGKGKSTYLL